MSLKKPFRGGLTRNDLDGLSDLSDMLESLTGIHKPLDEKNLSLFLNRLVPLMEKHKINGFKEYYESLHKSKSTLLKSEFISALTTNTTEFYRENSHFTFLNNYLKDLSISVERPLRMWCAAASTGQEAFTMLFVCLEAFQSMTKESLRFLVTDIDPLVLKVAMAGVYTEAQVVGLPYSIRDKYMQKLAGNKYEVKPEYKKLLRIYKYNLKSYPYKFNHRFDVLFCRNVLIYFSDEGANQVVESMIKVLAPGGLLFVGHVETGLKALNQLEMVSPGVYKKAGD